MAVQIKGNRQRGTLPLAPSEFASQAFLVDLIRRTISPAWRFTHIPLGELRDPATAARLKRMGVTPDFPIWCSLARMARRALSS